ncbi:MAG: hypothetical protein K0R29_2775 [Pseudobdellovibrio sp.]|jgi:hypothetical protein|nr:hypothetical protein [Pseudobdellovibrio sp.]
MPISLKLLKTLEVSAASGIVNSGGFFYIVADDELSLVKISADLKSEAVLVPLIPGHLPADPQARKKSKPDFEAIVEIWPGSLLVLPSGSKPNRNLGILLSGENITQIDCTNLYTELLNVYSELNIEGAVVSNGQLLLFQRGNGSLRQNGIIKLQMDLLVDDLQNGAMKKSSFVNSMPIELGSLGGVPLSFTDAAIETSEKIWFVAAAEATNDTYNDGAFFGAVLGLLNAEGKILYSEKLLCPAKPEGLCLDLKEREFYVVTDSDDLGIKSGLYRGDLPSILRRK